MKLLLPTWLAHVRWPISPVTLACILVGAGPLLPAVTPGAKGAGLGIDLKAPAKARARSRELAQMAYNALERGDSARALSLLDEAETLYPNQADSYNLRGTVYLRRGDYVRAASAFSRAAALDPELWAARFNFADIPFKQKDYARARVLFDRLVDGTDRYKSTARWELAQYKAGLSCLLNHDEAGATRRLSLLVAPGPTPSAAGLHAQAALAFARRDTSTGNRLLMAAQTSCKPAVNALYLPALSTAGWVTPVAVPIGLPHSAIAANGRNGNSHLTYLPGNLPITEPDLPGGIVSGSPTANALLEGGKARPMAPPLVLPEARPLIEPESSPLQEGSAPMTAVVAPATKAPPTSETQSASEHGLDAGGNLSPASPTSSVPGAEPHS